MSTVDNAHPAEVQAAADAAVELTSQVWHFESSDAIEAAITKIEKRSPLTFARPEISTMVTHYGKVQDHISRTVAHHNSTAMGRHQNRTKVRHKIIRLYHRSDRNTRIIAGSETETQ